MNKENVVRWETTTPDGEKVLVVRASEYDALKALAHLQKLRKEMKEPFWNSGEGSY